MSQNEYQLDPLDTAVPVEKTALVRADIFEQTTAAATADPEDFESQLDESVIAAETSVLQKADLNVDDIVKAAKPSEHTDPSPDLQDKAPQFNAATTRLLGKFSREVVAWEPGGATSEITAEANPEAAADSSFDDELDELLDKAYTENEAAMNKAAASDTSVDADKEHSLKDLAAVSAQIDGGAAMDRRSKPQTWESPPTEQFKLPDSGEVVRAQEAQHAEAIAEAKTVRMNRVITPAQAGELPTRTDLPARDGRTLVQPIGKTPEEAQHLSVHSHDIAGKAITYVREMWDVLQSLRDPSGGGRHRMR